MPTKRPPLPNPTLQAMKEEALLEGLPPEPCYWCNIPIQNPDFWPTCGRTVCLANTNRWFLQRLKELPDKPKPDFFNLQMLNFVQSLAKGIPGSSTKLEWVIPPAARTRPLGILEGDRQRFMTWCLEVYSGKVPSESLPEYLRYQIENRINRSKLEAETKRGIKGFHRAELVKERDRIRKKKAIGIGS